MITDDFDFDLPRALIAQRPVVPRDAARLLVVGTTLADQRIRDLPGLLRPGDLLVFNDARVIPARLFGRRGQAKIEVTLHRLEDTGAEGQDPAGALWRAFARPARRLRVGDRLDFGPEAHAPELWARVAAKGARGEVSLAFNLTETDLKAALGRVGVLPLPPYIRREGGADLRDREDYQTVYAVKEGAIAAPTAGLHFTPDLLRALDRRGVERLTITLYVGAGTFLPVTAAEPRDHRMLGEVGELGPGAAAAINAAKAAGRRVVAVGTTALRLLESASDEQGRLRPFSGETDLFILPGYRFKVVDRLLTNFHLPRSTLFMLVCAFAGQARMTRTYGHAMERGYRFYSYGDCCLLAPEAAT